MNPLVGIITASRIDFEVMSNACDTLQSLGVPFEACVVSAHRTHFWMAEYPKTAESRGLKVLITVAGGAAHLPGMVAASSDA